MFLRRDEAERLIEDKLAELFGRPTEGEMATKDDVTKALGDLRAAAQNLAAKAREAKADTSAADNDEFIGELRAIGSLIDEATGRLEAKPADAPGGDVLR